MAVDMLLVEVAYAREDVQRIVTVEVMAGSSIETAIDRSGILDVFPEIDLGKMKVGVFGKIRKLTDLVKAGDRVEIYRELVIDPKEARRGRAIKQKKR